MTKAATQYLDVQHVKQPQDLIRSIAFTYSPRLGVRLGKLNAEFSYMFIEGKLRNDSILGGIFDNAQVEFGHYKVSLVYLWGNRAF